MHGENVDVVSLAKEAVVSATGAATATASAVTVGKTVEAVVREL
jgi:hypothetical protein